MNRMVTAFSTAFVCMLVLISQSLAAEDVSIADAVEKREPARITELLEQGADINATQADGMSAIHWAVFYEQAELTKQLIASGARVDAANRYGVTPLSIACENGNEAIVELLLAAGAEANSKLPGGETMLMLAARTGKLEPVHKLIEQAAEVNAKERHGQTAIMWAAAEGHATVVDALIKAGAEFKKPLKSGFTPLMFAVRQGRVDAVRCLLQAGADVNEQMNPERTGGRNPRRGMSPLHMAVENGHFELAVVLLEAGADPNDQRCGFTALHNITWVRRPPRGDDVGGAPAPIGSGNMTSLQFVRALVEHGADVNARLIKGESGRGKLNHKGATVFLFAAQYDDIPLMKLLLELGADPTLTNEDNCTPLMAAAGIGALAPGEEAGTEEEAIEAIELLLSLGADVNHVDSNGETAMHAAAYKSAPAVIDFLADRGAKASTWNQKNKYGWTPTLIAEGHRPGNFKPAAETLAAVYRQLIAAGITPPPLTPREIRKGYE